MDSKTILIVDDDDSLLALLKLLLQSRGFTTMEAHDGEEGLITAMKHQPDLIILDVEMPKMRGWEVCKLLKHNKFTSSIPIIMLTSRAELSDIIVAMQQGADDYLSKPFEEDELLERIDRLLSGQDQAKTNFHGSR